MPFIARCSQSACQKFNLVEDQYLGQRVTCLVCKQPFVAANSTQPAAPDPNVRTCPQCQSRLRVPANAGSAKVRCPKCGTVFP